MKCKQSNEDGKRFLCDLREKDDHNVRGHSNTIESNKSVLLVEMT
jgi:hypothetical protein